MVVGKDSNIAVETLKYLIGPNIIVQIVAACILRRNKKSVMPAHDADAVVMILTGVCHTDGIIRIFKQ